MPEKIALVKQTPLYGRVLKKNLRSRKMWVKNITRLDILCLAR